MGVNAFELGPFTGGVNLTDPLTKLKEDELSLCQNTRMGVRGDFYKRPGHDYYGAPSAPSKVNGDKFVNLLVRFYRSSSPTKELIAAANGRLKKGNDSTGAWTQIDIDGGGSTNMNSDNLCDFMIYKNYLYIADGTKPQRWNGTDNIYAGHFLYGAPSLTDFAAGALSAGTYKYFITSVEGDRGEGPKGTEGSIVLGAGRQVQVGAADAAAKYAQTAKNIYRTKANGTLFYYVTTLPVGTTTYNDNTPDASLGTASFGEFIPTHKPPDEARFCIMGHDDRAYWFGRTGANASIIEVSDVGFPDRIIDATGFFTVANNDGDIVTGGGLAPAGIVFFKRNSIWLSRAFGYGLINITPKEKRGVGLGTVSPFSIVTTPAGLIFLSQRGEVYLFDGTNVTEVGRQIKSEFNGMTQAGFEKVVACYHDYRYQISYDWRGQKGYNWKTLEYDVRTGKWEGPHTNIDFHTPSYYSVWDSVLDKGELAWGESKSTAGSYVYVRTEFTKTDRGNKFISAIRTGQLALAKLGEIISTKIFVFGKFSGDAIIQAVHINESGVRTIVNLSTPIPAGGSKLNDGKDVGPSGNVAKWGEVVLQVLEGSLATSARSRIPQYEITDGGTAQDGVMDLVEVLVEALPLK